MKVLMTNGYGAGWSTWNDPRMAFDKVLIEAFEKGISRDGMERLCMERGYDDIYGGAPYMGGFKHLVVKEIPDGSLFKIKENDGKEYIEYFDMDDWYVAEGEYYDID